MTTLHKPISRRTDLGNRKRGRPRSARYTIPIHVYLDEQHAKMLKQLAEYERKTESACIRDLIRGEYEMKRIPYGQ